MNNKHYTSHDLFEVLARYKDICDKINEADRNMDTKERGRYTEEGGKIVEEMEKIEEYLKKQEELEFLKLTLEKVSKSKATEKWRLESILKRIVGREEKVLEALKQQIE